MPSLLNRLHHIRKGKTLGTEQLDVLEPDLPAETLVETFPQPVGSSFPCHLSAATGGRYGYNGYRYRL